MLPKIKACREAVAAIISVALTAEGSPALVMAYGTADIEQQSPAVIVLTDKTALNKDLLDTYSATMHFSVVGLVRYDSVQQERDSEDALDLIDWCLIDAFGKTANQVTHLWQSVNLRQAPRDNVNLGGATYRYSQWEVQVEVMNR